MIPFRPAGEQPTPPHNDPDAQSRRYQQLTNPKKVVTPAKAGVQLACNYRIFLDAGFRRHDESDGFSTFLRCHQQLTYKRNFSIVHRQEAVPYQTVFH
jgi:hypothetical protein